MTEAQRIRGIVIDDVFLFEMWYEDFILYQGHPNAIELLEQMIGENFPMNKKLLYLSGPMTGIADLNRQAFADAEYRLREMGFACINPHDIPAPETEPEASYEEHWAECLALDVWTLVKTNRPDAVVMLAGWRQSRGSLLEAAVARRFGIPVYTYGQILKGELKP